MGTRSLVLLAVLIGLVGCSSPIRAVRAEDVARAYEQQPERPRVEISKRCSRDATNPACVHVVDVNY